jgi:hypothetical protein
VLAFIDAARGPTWRAYEGAARRIDDLRFAVTHDKDVFAAANRKHGDVIMYKQHPPEELVFTLSEGGSSRVQVGSNSSCTAPPDSCMRDLIEWVKIQRLPIVADLTEHTAKAIFDAPVKARALLFIADDQDADVRAAREALQLAAAHLRGQVVAVSVAARDNMQMLEHFSVIESKTPCLYLAVLGDKTGKTKRIKGPTAVQIKANALEATTSFLQAYANGELAQDSSHSTKGSDSLDDLLANVIDFGL